MFMAMVVEVFLVVAVMYLLFFLMSSWMENTENSLSPYECGFEPMMGSRVSFSHRFFLISILFLVFDVEISLLVPIPYLEMEWVSGWLGMVFMAILFLGLGYEYYNGVLSWLV